MAKVVMDDDAVVTREGEGAASSAIWAIAFIIIVGLLALVVWKSGILNSASSSPTKQVDIEVSAPSR
jgi:hypothetical protein